jgi:PKD repeat protein
VYLRIFDGDTGGAFDTAFGRFGETRTRFALYSGPLAFQGAHRGHKPGVGETAIRGQGFELAEWTVGEDPAMDAQWHTLAKLDPAAGALVDGRRVFRLEVEGIEGDDANVFDLAVSTQADANHLPPGLRLFSYEPTLRLYPGNRAMELPLQLPETATTLRLSHFDLESRTITFVGPFRDASLQASGEGRWRTAQLVLEADEPGRRAAVVLPGGGSLPNDMALFLTTPEGLQLAFELPGRPRPPNARPQAAARVTPQSCDRVAYDGGPSRDAEGEALSYRWLFADGSELTGQQVVREYPGPGTEQVRLEVSDSTGRIGNATVWQQEVVIRTPPVARIEAPTLTAPGQEVVFSGSASSATDARIAQYSWRFGDGTLAEGAEVRHSFERPGRYPVRLLVRDDSDHPCSSASAELTVTVNAPPVAHAGPDRTAAVGQIITFDATASNDPDGAIAHYQWDFGDGRTAQGPRPSIAYETPGDYRVRLTVTDDSRLANSTAVSEITLTVVPPDNSPPVADAGPDRSVIAGAILQLDGSGSADPDGNIIDFRWDFGDGKNGHGMTPAHRFSAAGTYEIRLTVEDDSD